MKKKLFFAFALTVLSVSALVGAENANAASVYDNIIDTYSEPKGIDDDYYIQSSPLDVAEFTTRELADYLRGNDELMNGYSIIIDTGNSSTCDSSDWINAGNRLMGDTFVSHSSDYYNGSQRLLNSATFYTYHDVNEMTMSFGSPLHAFNNRGVYRGGFIANGSVDTVRITAYMSGTDIYLNCYNGAADTLFQWQGSSVPTGSAFVLGYLYDSWYPDDTASWQIYFLNHLPSGVNVTYPEGYEGDGIPEFPPIDEGAGQPDYYQWVPNFHVSVADDWKATIHDTNFNTFDGNPFLCGGEFAPILHYELWDRTGEEETLLFTAYNSATVQIDYQFTKKPTSQDFRIVGWYECAPEDEMEFTESGYKDFTINGQGDLFITGLETCVTAEFPFLNWNSCMVGINSLLATLAFNFSNPTNQGLTNVAAANPNNCYTMGALGDWIGRPNQELCAAFSAEVRNTITPFVTFILGAVVFMYISRSKATVVS